MLLINESFSVEDKTTYLDQEDVERVAKNAIETIKRELPEEAQTVEGVEYVLDEMKKYLKAKRISL